MDGEVEASRREQGLESLSPLVGKRGSPSSASVEGDRDSESMRESVRLRRRHAGRRPARRPWRPRPPSQRRCGRVAEGGGEAKMRLAPE